MQNELPKVKKKKIDVKEFVKLAKKVKSIFEEEAKYIEKTAKENGNHTSTKFIISS